MIKIHNDLHKTLISLIAVFLWFNVALVGPSVTLLDFYYVGVSGLYRAWIDHGTWYNFRKLWQIFRFWFSKQKAVFQIFEGDVTAICNWLSMCSYLAPIQTLKFGICLQSVCLHSNCRKVQLVKHIVFSSSEKMEAICPLFCLSVSVCIDLDRSKSLFYFMPQKRGLTDQLARPDLLHNCPKPAPRHSSSPPRWI